MSVLRSYPVDEETVLTERALLQIPTRAADAR